MPLLGPRSEDALERLLKRYTASLTLHCASCAPRSLARRWAAGALHAEASAVPCPGVVVGTVLGLGALARLATYKPGARPALSLLYNAALFACSVPLVAVGCLHGGRPAAARAHAKLMALSTWLYVAGVLYCLQGVRSNEAPSQSACRRYTLLTARP